MICRVRIAPGIQFCYESCQAIVDSGHKFNAVPAKHIQRFRDAVYAVHIDDMV